MPGIKKQAYGTAWAEQMWEDSWTYIRTVVDTATDPFLILDKDLRVLAANKSFYKLFQVEAKNTEYKHITELGNGVWNIATLNALLTGILPNNTFFSGFEVNSEFPAIGKRIILLNGRRIYKEGETSVMFPPLILLAMVDITQMTVIAAELADYAARIEKKMNERTLKLEVQVRQLNKEVGDLKTTSRKKKVG
jgi:nitrogen-specific signal transduction histidine kinase